MNDALFSSKSEEWSTPQDFFDALNDEFHFDLDPCAADNNHKCDAYFTKADNGLDRSWAGHCVFCNPPYGNKSTAEWIRKCAKESKKNKHNRCLVDPGKNGHQGIPRIYLSAAGCGDPIPPWTA